MRLYDRTKNVMGFRRFLGMLKSIARDKIILQNIEKYLVNLDNQLFKELITKLLLIRNKKYSHIDPDNAMGEPPKDQLTGSVIDLTKQEFEGLLDKAIEITSMCAGCFNIDPKNYIAIPYSAESTLDNLMDIMK